MIGVQKQHLSLTCCTPTRKQKIHNHSICSFYFKFFFSPPERKVYKQQWAPSPQLYTMRYIYLRQAKTLSAKEASRWPTKKMEFKKQPINKYTTPIVHWPHAATSRPLACISYLHSHLCSCACLPFLIKF